jgi:hypothetical protein
MAFFLTFFSIATARWLWPRRCKNQCWQFYYFESGANEPYCRKTFRSRKEMECALARFLRLGGDDDLQVVAPDGSRIT